MGHRSFLKVVLKPEHRSQEEYQVVVHGPEYEAWKAGDKAIPLSHVVDSFDVFVTLCGNQGVMGRASKMQLENAFGTAKEVDVLSQILERGTLMTSKQKGGYATTNDSKLGGNQLSLGSSGGFGGR